MGYRMGKDVSVEHDNHSHNSAQSNGMPNDEPEDLSFVSYLIGSRCRHNDRLRVDHLAHHTPSAVGCNHQYRIKIELLRGNALQASEQRIRRSVAAGERNSQPAEERAKEREEPSSSRKGQSEDSIHA